MLSIGAVCYCAVQVLLYDPLFDWTMNPLKAFYLQHDEQQELNATLGSTMGGDDLDNHRKSRCHNRVFFVLNALSAMLK